MNIGDQIGTYTLVAPLGNGAMGMVWEAVLRGPRGFRRPVALKLLRAKGARETLVREARLGALLSHPNIVAVHDLGDVDDHLYVAMELVRGASVQQLAWEASLPAAAVVEIGLQAAMALTHFHGLMVEGLPSPLIHRDIKPGNLLVDRAGLVKVSDLGIARLAAEPRQLSGTPGYIAPEQLAGVEDVRADQFALGATLCVLATRRRPFGQGRQALARVRQADAWVQDHKLVAEVDAAVPGLGIIVGTCLQQNPNERYPDAGALTAALRALRGQVTGGPSLAELVARCVPGMAPVDAVHVALTASLEEGLPPRRGGNLPVGVRAYVGRRHALARVRAHIASGDPLVTLQGVGGAGKTRMAIELGHSVAATLRGGGWFCDLRTARTEREVSIAVADALGLQLGAGDLTAQVGRALRRLGPALVILDHLDRCVKPTGAALAEWFQIAPEVRFLATSRRALQLGTQRRITVGSLAVHDAMELFQQRAETRVSAADLPTLRTLVTRLDALPLAVELAAARTRSLSLSAILVRLEHRFELLQTTDTNTPARHRSMRASLDGSWELLSAREQSALAQLSVFEDEFTISAAEAVLDLQAWPEAPWALDVIWGLVDNSLVRSSTAADRFQLLDTVRAYAAEKRADPDGAAARHRAWYAQHGKSAALDPPDAGRQLQELFSERENLLGAVRSALVANDVEHIGALALAVSRALALAGPSALAIEILEAALPRSGDRSAEVAAALSRWRERDQADGGPRGAAATVGGPRR